ncbi:hypothetical protein [Desulforegula conservatrix]|uniref:hypothetical protein n=1 Tax=Desulforegula conservatrix TaxID=153026 RepID=UPI0003FD9F41|nr:hypothetical protein [Desulforegula conservatrix]
MYRINHEIGKIKIDKVSKITEELKAKAVLLFTAVIDFFYLLSFVDGLAKSQIIVIQTKSGIQK